jgi:hypothetical protein
MGRGRAVEEERQIAAASPESASFQKEEQESTAEIATASLSEEEQKPAPFVEEPKSATRPRWLSDRCVFASLSDCSICRLDCVN